MRDGAKRFLRTAGLLARPRSGSQLRLFKDASSLICEIDADERRNSFDGVEQGSRRPYLRSTATRFRYPDGADIFPRKDVELATTSQCLRVAFRFLATFGTPATSGREILRETLLTTESGGPI